MMARPTESQTHKKIVDTHQKNCGEKIADTHKPQKVVEKVVKVVDTHQISMKKVVDTHQISMKC